MPLLLSFLDFDENETSGENEQFETTAGPGEELVTTPAEEIEGTTNQVLS